MNALRLSRQAHRVAERAVRALEGIGRELERYNDRCEGEATEESTVLPPSFVHRHAGPERFVVEAEAERVHITDRDGAPSTATILMLVHGANVDGWRLDTYAENGHEMEFIPADGSD